MQAQPVLDVISNRIHHNKQHHGRHVKADRFKLGLAVEGGGMRGTVSLSMLMALRDLKLLDIFDEFVGVSAGGLNLAYVLSGRGASAMSVYLDDMTKPGQLDLTRIRDPEHAIMDMRALCKCLKAKPIDTDYLARHYGDNFHFAATNISSANAEFFTPRTAADDLYEFLVAGSTMPIIGGKPWELHGQKYFDGGLSYINAFQAAAVLGCSHILVLNTHAWGHEIKPYAKLTSRIIKRLDDEHNGAGSLYLRNLQAYCDIVGGLPYGPVSVGGTQLYRHAVQGKLEVGRLTRDPLKLMSGAAAGYQSILNLFGPGKSTIMVPAMV